MLCSAKSSPCIARFILTTTLVRYPYYPHCISCLLLCSQLQLKTKTVYYLTASVGQESGRSLVGRFWLSISQETIIKVWTGLI